MAEFVFELDKNILAALKSKHIKRRMLHGESKNTRNTTELVLVLCVDIVTPKNFGSWELLVF